MTALRWLAGDGGRLVIVATALAGSAGGLLAGVPAVAGVCALVPLAGLVAPVRGG